jgi:hypothetical protein
MRSVFIFRKTIGVIAASLVITLVSSISFSVLEPELVLAIEDQFTITQSVTSEISFLTPASNVTMNGALAGVTGGTSNGQTQVVVYTNAAAGYTMTIKASSTPAMQGNTQGSSIADYTPATAGIPDYAYSVPTSAEFAYTVSASTTSDLAQKFLDNGSSACNTGSSDTSESTSCWYGLSTVATSTITRATATSASGATTTVFFRLKINSGTNVVEDTYTATTTLTATAN